jgi:hypothetical protein
MTDLFMNVLSLLLRSEDEVQALQVNCTVSWSLLQEHGYRNTTGMDMFQGTAELGYGTYPAQLRMLR